MLAYRRYMMTACHSPRRSSLRPRMRSSREAFGIVERAGGERAGRTAAQSRSARAATFPMVGREGCEPRRGANIEPGNSYLPRPESDARSHQRSARSPFGRALAGWCRAIDGARQRAVHAPARVRRDAGARHDGFARGVRFDGTIDGSAGLLRAADAAPNGVGIP